MRPIDLTIVQRTVALSRSKIGQQSADQFVKNNLFRRAELSGNSDE